MRTREAAQVPASLESAYRECIAIARSHYENFSVASRLMPDDMLPHVAAIYTYCRGVDDLGDEAEGNRLALLDEWAAQLEQCYTGSPTEPRFLALQHTISAFDIDRQPFLDLIEANRMDQLNTRYETYEDVLYYCRHSANPVGRLYLTLIGLNDPERRELSDATCTALQLANFWQDVKRDHAMGRIYLPQEDMRRFGYTEEELARGEYTPAFRNLMAFQVDRTRRLFDNGLPLVDTLEDIFKLHVKLFTLGGVRVLDAIERQHYDVLSRRPTVTKARKTWLLTKTWLRMKLSRQI
ncbi:MAG: squalene synthase HpnC [Chloroflexi bacterium]|nr:squalene synthase HpnC [Chloroflexota bacterium]